MTSGERKALLFLAGIGVLGAAARVVTAPSSAPSRTERAALDAQIGAVDSAWTAARAAKPTARRRRTRAAHEAVAGRAVPTPPPARATSSTPSAGGSQTLVDVDVANVAELDGLPGIGPALARRIVDDRAARGPFGSLAGLERVRGVGPKLAARIAPRVTFSGVSRPSPAGVVPTR